MEELLKKMFELARGNGQLENELKAVMLSMAFSALSEVTLMIMGMPASLFEVIEEKLVDVVTDNREELQELRVASATMGILKECQTKLAQLHKDHKEFVTSRKGL